MACLLQEIWMFTAWYNHCNERESQVHLGIKYDRRDHALQCGISVQYKAQYIGCEGNQQAFQDGKARETIFMRGSMSATR